MQRQSISEIISLLPNHVYHFEGSEYQLPVKTTFYGNDEVDIQNLKKQLVRNRDEDVKELLEPVLLAAELYEASCEDKDRFFISDQDLRSYVFNGSKWKAGWVLILGSSDQNSLIEKLKARNFMIFTDVPEIPDTYYIGSRDTSPVYFLQMMVRYGLIWGRISPGDDHEMGHFLERDMPGFMIIYRELPALKYMIALGLMKLGAPAVVPSAFPFPYGNRVVADNDDDIVDSGMRFSNLRLRYYKDEVISLPDFCNPAFVNEKIEANCSFGGTVNSFFCLRPSTNIEKTVRITGLPSREMGILVEVEDEHMSHDMAFIIEQTALKAINYIHGVKALEKEDIFYLDLESESGIDSQKIGDAIYWGIRLNYPRLEKIRINIIYEPVLLEKEADSVHDYKQMRRKYIKEMTEENTEEFCVCTECRPFSLEHTCILTPDRLPMCASRTYFSTKAASYFGLSSIPYQRQSEKGLPLKHVFMKGRALDIEKGEYEGCNRIYSDMTGGRLDHVYLHSLRKYPHTSCGCFQNLAFWIEEVKGIGIMSRNSKAMAPNGKTWDTLANYAGGKQSDGIMGVSLSYIRSRHFLKGDGGIANVVWVDSDLYKKISGSFLPGQKVSTEMDVYDIKGLREFINR
jgi:CO dehydrogenase/acetyl-CoA synthase beta subunit